MRAARLEELTGIDDPKIVNMEYQVEPTLDEVLGSVAAKSSALQQSVSLHQASVKGLFDLEPSHDEESKMDKPPIEAANSNE
jgi:hypothetical protein